MTITPVNATTVKINGLSMALAGLTISLIGQSYLQVIRNSDKVEIVPKTKWTNLNNGSNNGVKFATQSEFLTAMGTAFNLNASGLKKGAFVANTATAPGAAYVQTEAAAVLTELRAVKTSLIAAGVLAAS